MKGVRREREGPDGSPEGARPPAQSVTAPTDAVETALMYLASAPRV
jgi:hypothetical protein